MKTYVTTASQGYRQFNRESFVNNMSENELSGFVMTMIGVFLSVTMLFVILFFAWTTVDEAAVVDSTPVKSAVVTKVGDTTLQIKYADGQQERLFLNDANKVPEKGQKVKVKRVLTFNHSRRFNLVGYNDDISTAQYPHFNLT